MHSLNLVLQEIGRKAPIIRDAKSLIREMGVYLNAFAFCKAKCKDIQQGQIATKRLFLPEFS